MRLQTILRWGAAFWLLLLVVCAVVLFGVIRDVTTSQREVRNASDIRRVVFELSTLTGDYLNNRNDRAQGQWRRKHTQLGELLKAADFTLVPEARVLAILNEGHGEASSAFGRLVAKVGAGGATANADKPAGALERRLISQILIEAQDMESAAFYLGNVSQDAMRDSIRTGFLTGGALLIGLLISIGATWMVIARRIVRPVQALRDGIKSIGDGHLDQRIGANSKDELGEVAASFDEMTDALEQTTVSRDALAREVETRRRAEANLEKLTATLDRRNADLEAVNQELESFAYTVSHDLRGPLRSIDGFTLALVEDYGDKLDDMGRDYTQRVRAAAVRMAQLIDDILKLSRISRAKLEASEIDLSEIAAGVVAMLKDAAPDRDVSVRIQPGVTGQGDPSLIRVVLENLLGNAWKYSARTDGPVVEFGRTHEDGDEVYYVRDNGAGFDMTYVDKLFKPFHRLHAENEFEGTGIGLATVARIVRRHGGRAWAHSDAGQGTTFYFTLSSTNIQKKAA